LPLPKWLSLSEVASSSVVINGTNSCVSYNGAIEQASMVPKLSQHWQSWTSQPSDPQEFDAAFLEMMQWLRQHLS
jgi:hypothetical protein